MTKDISSLSSFPVSKQKALIEFPGIILKTKDSINILYSWYNLCTPSPSLILNATHIHTVWSEGFTILTEFTVRSSVNNSWSFQCMYCLHVCKLSYYVLLAFAKKVWQIIIFWWKTSSFSETLHFYDLKLENVKYDLYKDIHSMNLIWYLDYSKNEGIFNFLSKIKNILNLEFLNKIINGSEWLLGNFPIIWQRPLELAVFVLQRPRTWQVVLDEGVTGTAVPGTWWRTASKILFQPILAMISLFLCHKYLLNLKKNQI